jgi:hypothetical protein
MQVDVVDLHNAIIDGLKKAWLNHFAMTDERDEDIRPEYLTTASVCYALLEFVDKLKIKGRMVIRAEEQTRSLWGKICLPRFLHIGSRQGLKSESRRKGNVDISFAAKRAGVEEPLGVVENKGFVLFTSSNILYASSMKELKKDIERNIEFVSGSDGQGIEYSAFTFYLRDKKSILESHGRDYRDCKKAYFSCLCKEIVSCYGDLHFHVDIDILESNLFSSKKEAEAIDEHGCPACTAEGTWNILYGIISIYRFGNTLIQEKPFNISKLNLNPGSSGFPVER